MVGVSLKRLDPDRARNCVKEEAVFVVRTWDTYIRT